jgi:hypothetical protein
MEITKKNSLKVFAELDTLSLDISRTNLFNSEVIYNYYFPKEIIDIGTETNGINFFDHNNFTLESSIQYRVDCERINNESTISQRKLFKNIPEQVEDELRYKIREWGEHQRTEPIKRLFPSHSQDINQELMWIKFVIEYEGKSNLEVCININDKRIKTCSNNAD